MVLNVGDIQAKAGLEDDLGPGLEALSKKVDDFVEKLGKSLTKGADEANDKMGAAHGAFAKVLEGVELGAGIAAFGALKDKVGEVTEYFMGAAEHVGQLSEHLSNLGAQTGFATDRLDSISKMGQIVNVSVDSIAMSMNRAQRSIEAGSKGATDALGKMGLDVQKFRDLKPEEQFDKIFDGLAKIPEGAQRTSAAMELLGRSGAQMLPLVGSVHQLEDRLKALGVTMSKESIEAASAFDDKMDILGIVMDSFREKIGTTVASSPVLQQALVEITDLLGMASKFMSDNLSVMTDWVSQGILYVADNLAAVVDWLAKFLDTLGGTNAVISNAVEIWDFFAGTIKFVWDLLVGLAAFVGDVLASVWVVVATALGELTGAELDMADATVSLKDVTDAMRLTWLSFKDLVLAVAESVLKAKAAFQDLKGDSAGALKTDAQVAALEKLRGEYAQAAGDIADGTEKASHSTDEFRKKLDAMIERLHASAEAMKKKPEAPGPEGPSTHSMTDAEQKALEAYNKEVEKLSGELAKMGAVGQSSFDQQRTAAVLAYEAALRQIDAMKGVSAAQKENLKAGQLQLEQAKIEAADADEFAKQAADAAAARKSMDDQLVAAQQRLGEAYNASLSPLQQTILKNKELADRTIDAANAAYKKLQATGQDTDADLKATQATVQAARALEEYNNELARNAEAHARAVARWNEMADSLASLVGLLDDFGLSGNKVTDMLGGLSKGMDIAAQAAAQGYLSVQQMAAAIGDIYKTGAEKGAGAGALSGAGQGAAIGALFGPMGAAAGAVAGGLIGALGGIFGKPEWKKVGERAGAILGTAIGDETAKALTETMHKAGVSMEQAILLNLDKIMADTGKTIQQMGGQVLELINTKFAAGSEAAKMQADQIDKAWQQVRSTATEVGDAMTVAMYQSAKAAGTMTQSMKDFEKAQEDLGISGAKKIAAGLAMIKTDDLKKLENFGPVAADFFTKGFEDAIAQKGLVGAIEEFGDSLTDVYKQMQETFPSQSSSAILAPFVNLKNVLDADDGTLKGMITTVEGMGDVLESNANRGLFDPEMQSSMGDALNQTFNALKDKTGDAKTSIQAILPELTKTIQASQQLGVPLDENTAKLKQQAEEMGFAFPAEPIVQLVDLMKTLVQGLGFALPQSANVASRSLDGLGKAGADGLAQTSDTIASLGEDAAAQFESISTDTTGVIKDVLAQSTDSMAMMAQSGIDSADTVSTAWNGTVSKIGMFVGDAVEPVAGSFQTMADESSDPLMNLLHQLNQVASAAGAIGANAAASGEQIANMGGPPAPNTPGGNPAVPPGTQEYDVGGEGIAGMGPLPRGGTPIVVHPGEHFQVTTAADTRKSMTGGSKVVINDNRTVNVHGAGNDLEIVKSVKKHLVNDTEQLRGVIRRYAR